MQKISAGFQWITGKRLTIILLLLPLFILLAQRAPVSSSTAKPEYRVDTLTNPYGADIQKLLNERSSEGWTYNDNIHFTSPGADNVTIIFVRAPK